MHLSAEAVGLVPALALAYVLAARRHPPGRLRIAAAAAGLALILLAFSTELQPLALHTFLWAHLLQNVVLAEWAPALLVLAVPPALATRARAFTLFRPLVALPLWIATYLVWHLPWVYDFALEHPHSLLHVEHLMYLAAGIALWWPVIHGVGATHLSTSIGPDSGARSLTATVRRHGAYSAGAKAAYMFGAFVLASPLGLVLALIPRPIYSFYEQARRTWGPGPLVDQQIAGVTMAIEQALVFFAVFTAFMLRFLRDEQAAGTVFTRQS